MKNHCKNAVILKKIIDIKKNPNTIELLDFLPWALYF